MGLAAAKHELLIAAVQHQVAFVSTLAPLDGLALACSRAVPGLERFRTRFRVSGVLVFGRGLTTGLQAGFQDQLHSVAHGGMHHEWGQLIRCCHPVCHFGHHIRVRMALNRRDEPSPINARHTGTARGGFALPRALHKLRWVVEAEPWLFHSASVVHLECECDVHHILDRWIIVGIAICVPTARLLEVLPAGLLSQRRGN